MSVSSESEAPRAVRVVLVEDHLAFAQALKTVFALEPDLEVVEVVDRPDAAGDAAHRHQPDVAVIDLDLPGGNGYEAVQAMRASSPGTQFLVVTALRDRVELGRMIEAGVSGVMHKSAEVSQIVEAVRKVAAGGNLVAPDVAGSLLADLRESRERGWLAQMTRRSLSPRELEVLSALAQGTQVADISRALHIAPGTVETHLKNIRGKLGVSSRLEAVVEALRLGLVDPPDGMSGTG